MKPRPTEVKAVRALLEGPAANAEELALRVVQALDEARAAYPTFIVVKAYRGALMPSYGPFPTALQAQKAVEAGTVPIIEGESFGIGRLWSPLHAQKSLEKADAPVKLTTKAGGKHPIPYAKDDEVSRKRYQRMSKKQRKAEFEKRLP